MNNTFSLHRVALYARKHYVENSRSYLFGLIGMMALSTLILYIEPKQYNENLGLLVLFGMVYFTQISCRSHYAHRSIEQSYTLPATSSEKYLFTWFNSAILSNIVSISIIGLISYIFTIIYKKPVGIDISEFELPLTIAGLSLFLLYQGCALLVCCWSKGSPLKGYLIVAALFLAGLITYIYLRFQAHEMNSSIDMFRGACEIHTDSASIDYSLIKGFSATISVTLAAGFWTIVLWFAAYFKFKERTLK